MPSFDRSAPADDRSGTLAPEQSRRTVRVDPRVPPEVGPPDRLERPPRGRPPDAPSLDRPQARGLAVDEALVDPIERHRRAVRFRDERGHGETVGPRARQHHHPPRPHRRVDHPALAVDLPERERPPVPVRLDPEHHLVLGVAPVEVPDDRGRQEGVHPRAGEHLLPAVAMAGVGVVGVLERGHDQGVRVEIGPVRPFHVIGGDPGQEPAHGRPVEAGPIVVVPVAPAAQVLQQQDRVDESDRAEQRFPLPVPRGLGEEGGPGLASFAAGHDEPLGAGSIVDDVVVVNDPQWISPRRTPDNQPDDVVIRTHVLSFGCPDHGRVVHTPDRPPEPLGEPEPSIGLPVQGRNPRSSRRNTGAGHEWSGILDRSGVSRPRPPGSIQQHARRRRRK